MFWENFVALCEKRGKKPNPVARELGVASGTVTEWKKGRIPQSVTLKKISDYFGVPVDALLDQSADEPQEKPVPGISAIPQDLPKVVAFKENFERICLEKRVSPSAVCEAIGLTRSAYSNWNEHSVPRKKTLEKLSEFLGVSVDALLDQPENLCRTVSDEEYEIILALRRQPDMLTPVRRLLALPDEVPTP